MSEVDVIKPFTGEPIGGQQRPSQTVRYQTAAGIVEMTPEAQIASKAAEQFAAAFPQFSDAVKKGVNNLDPVSQQKLTELRRQMRSTIPKPATVINLHPWKLTFGSTNRFLRGIEIPACQPGMPYAYQHIRSYRTDWKYNEDGGFEFGPILPIHLAGEFLRTFSNMDIYGGGIIIYEGDGNPEKVDLVESYDPIGRLLTIDRPGIEYDEENNPARIMIPEPIKRSLPDLLEAARKQRNSFYLSRVKQADRDYHRPDGKGKLLVTDVHVAMADMLVAEGVLSAVPQWDLAGRMESGLRDEDCPSCGAQPKADSFKCSTCNHILDPFEAYMHGAVEYGHASMDLLSTDEMILAEKEKDRRVQAKKEARERMKAEKEAEKDKKEAEADKS